MQYKVIAPLSVILLILDQITKHLVLGSLALWESRTLIPGLLNLVHVRNRGAAFGFLNSNDTTWQNWFFVAATVLAMGVLLRIAASAKRDSLLLFSGLGCILGGAAGNLVDRLRLGEVIDFLDLYVGSYHWPAFNLADSAITLGVVLLIAALYKQR